MDSLKYFQIIGGIGVLIFSLRYLNAVLEGLVSRRFKPFISRVLSGDAKSSFFGFYTTLALQASSITMISAMGLLNTSIISIEQGILIFLGASLGSSIKGLIMTSSLYEYGFLFLGISSILLMFFKKVLYRDILQIFMSIGFAFLGFFLISEALSPILKEEIIAEYLKTDKSDLSNQFYGALVGLIMAVAFQSSSSVLFLVTGLGFNDLIKFDIGTSLMLGANIGTTSTALLMSLEYNRNVKKLALSYLIIKVIGVLITLFFFPYFLSLSEFFSQQVPIFNNNGYKIAFANILFNLISLVWWMFFYNFVLKFLNTVLPTQDTNLSLPSVIKKIVMSNPTLAINELKKQVKQIETVTKNLTDSCIELLLIKKVSRSSTPSLMISKEFEVLKDQIYQILIHVNKNYKYSVEKDNLEKDFKFLSECSDFYYHALSFRTHLERGLYVDYYFFSEEMQSYFEKFEKLFNQLWLSVLLNKGSYEKVNEIYSLLKEMENYYFELLISSNKKYSYEHLSWIYETLNYLHQMVDHLINLSKVSPYMEKSLEI